MQRLEKGTKFRIIKDGGVYEFIEDAELRDGIWWGGYQWLRGKDDAVVQDSPGVPEDIQIVSRPTEDLGPCAACGAKAVRCPHMPELTHAVTSWCTIQGLGDAQVGLCEQHWREATTGGGIQVADMIRSRRAASETKHGDYCSGIATKDGSRVVGYVGFDHGWKENGRKLIGLYEKRGDSSAPLVFVDTLRREEGPKSPHATDSTPDPEIEQFLPKKPKADPYAEHRLSLECSRGFAQWVALQSGAAIGLRDEAKKPERKNFGPCGTRDRYGQKKSLRGWETEEE